MDMTPQEYQDYVAKKAKKSPIVKDTILAFLIGGAICALGQGITALWSAAGLDKEAAGTATSVSLVFLSVLLTGLNLYNKIGRFGGRVRWCPSPALPTPSLRRPLTSGRRALSPAWRRKCSWWQDR